MQKILVIDDDAMVRASISATLSKQGFGVLEAEDGCSAIRVLKKYQLLWSSQTSLCRIKMVWKSSGK